MSAVIQLSPIPTPPLLPPPLPFLSALPISPRRVPALQVWSCRKEPLHRLLLPNLTADADCPCVGIVGGRTAWSSTVTVGGHHNIPARYWYDGQYINNAKEDAAEVVLKMLNPQQPRGLTTYSGQLFPQASSGTGGY